MNEKYELIKFSDGSFSLDVNVSPSEDTVWLTQKQICELFCSSKSNISEHIKHILEANELKKLSVVRKIRTTASDGKGYSTQNLKFMGMFANKISIEEIGHQLGDKLPPW